MTMTPVALLDLQEVELPKCLHTYQKERSDEDLVSTLETKCSAKDSSHSQKKACIICNEIMTDADNASDTSSLTTTGIMKTPMSTMENQMSQVTTQMTQLGDLMKQMLEQGQQNKSPATSATYINPASHKGSQLATTPETTDARLDSSRRSLSDNAEAPTGGSPDGYIPWTGCNFSRRTRSAAGSK
jgi:hypothetical protein